MSEEVRTRTSSGFGVASLVLGIVSLVFSFIPFCNYICFLLGLLAVVFAIIGLVKHDTGKSVAGLVMGILSLVSTPLMIFVVYNALFAAAAAA